ncbi:hypothetical protein I4U23_001210 [Adineta vaga]|nr:hypothetical protein I4U23_001210 [Adineta vaga]
MNISSPACAVAKCETSSCAKCHCCETDLCLDHLKEHKDQLNEKLIPIANQINIILDDLEHFDPSTTPSFIHLEQWHIAAHETIDLFYRNMQTKLHEQVRNQPLEKLSTTRDKLNQLIQRRGATREIIASLNNDIQLIQQQIDRLRNIPINLRPLVIDDSIIISSNLSNRVQQYNKNEDDLAKLQNGTAFQIFVTVIDLF